MPDDDSARWAAMIDVRRRTRCRPMFICKRRAVSAMARITTGAGDLDAGPDRRGHDRGGGPAGGAGTPRSVISRRAHRETVSLINQLSGDVSGN